VKNDKKTEDLIIEDALGNLDLQETEGEDLRQKLEELQCEIDELTNRLLRSQADFDNYRRRSRKELAEMAQFGAEKIIVELLPVLDNFERALLSVKDEPELQQFVVGMEMIYRQLKGVLEKEGLKEIEAVNEAFDPEKHHAVAQIPTSELEDNVIVEEIQKGYFLNDKVIRASTVCVSKKEADN